MTPKEQARLDQNMEQVGQAIVPMTMNIFRKFIVEEDLSRAEAMALTAVFMRTTIECAFLRGGEKR